MLEEKKSEYNRFIGKWILNINGERVSIEFLKGGTFNCYSKNSTYQKLLLLSEEYDQKYSFFNTPKISPTWNIVDGKLKILISNKEKNFKYYFSENDKNLNLTNTETRESLTFTKDLSNPNLGSMVNSLFKIKILVLALYFSFLFFLLFLVKLLGLNNIYFIPITWGLVVFLAIFLYLFWKKRIIPKLKA